MADDPTQPGWFHLEGDDRPWRYFDGTQWTDRTLPIKQPPVQKPARPVSLITVGLVLMLLGYMVASGASGAASSVLGFLVMFGGVCAAGVGVTATGSRLGTQMTAWERQQEMEEQRPLDRGER